jgi:hypothetical protein
LSPLDKDDLRLGVADGKLAAAFQEPCRHTPMMFDNRLFSNPAERGHGLWSGDNLLDCEHFSATRLNEVREKLIGLGLNLHGE